MLRSSHPEEKQAPVHSRLVRVSHWLVTAAVLALLVTGVEILLSHPRFYWGESGNVNMTPLFRLPVASSRATVPTGYGLLPDQNGWSRSVHFEAAWVLVLTGLAYVLAGFSNEHLRRDVLPVKGGRGWSAWRGVIAGYVSGAKSRATGYNAVQRWVYAGVIFGLFPLLVWTGLALSPALASAFPLGVSLLGGRQTARTLHFFLTVVMLLFLGVHVAMVAQAGFVERMRGMIRGGRRRARAEETV